MLDDEVLCFPTESSPVGNAAQPDYHEAVMASPSSTETEARTEHTTSSAVMCVEEEPVTPNPFIPEKNSTSSKKGQALSRTCQDGG